MKWLLSIALLVASGSDAREKISVVIPCHYKHYKHLPELLDSLAAQTRLPDEVIISVSMAHLILRKSSYNLILKPIHSPSRQFHTQTRCLQEKIAIAAENASGDILIAQDADDLLHQQSLQIIEYFFSTYPVDHLIYRWSPGPNLSLSHRVAHSCRETLTRRTSVLKR